jgi:hypothetical protein
MGIFGNRTKHIKEGDEVKIIVFPGLPLLYGTVIKKHWLLGIKCQYIDYDSVTRIRWFYSGSIIKIEENHDDV